MPVVNMRKGRGVLAGEIRIDRKTEFGNPCRLLSDTKQGRLNCLAAYSVYLVDRLNADTDFRERVMTLEGAVLACWCAPKLCHGHALLYVASLLNQGLIPGYRDVVEGAIIECYK